MSAYATPSDLAARWRVLTGLEDSQAETLLSDAAVWLRVWFPDLDARIEAGDVDAQVAVMLSCAMVKRAMIASGHEGQSSGLAVMGPFTEQVVFRNPEGNLYITEQEKILLDGRSDAVSMECSGL
ncbi:Gp19/Gp15/Gp42 family protein [Gordonia amicalis]|uniref:Gp19/Gp15/Gp42 family protein n=1 Tax=Gordonia amicalis TaxID=89053 RepID=UPI0024B90BA9|nr:Gp19/Gp15/Gp42 family protein [Gordonia amicalis]MDJ0454411.1 Gp19/Gp15/Gp42 family protein [Gordonia amicalis]MDV7077700.1 Gp19/Gp15/Gp42 family protein [Gordonia amicalis]